jgi:hypothetical protein
MSYVPAFRPTLGNENGRKDLNHPDFPLNSEP